MHALARLAAILGLALILGACGGSGGSGDGSRGATDSEATPGVGAQPTPAEHPGTVPPLACDGAERICPEGYRCVADPTASCDPATGTECAGICVLGAPLPGCGGFDAAPCADGTVCVDDPADDCAGGPAVDCPGICRPLADGECTDDSTCPVLDARCAACADGTYSCPISGCINGACGVETKPCAAAPPCGGLTGAACAPGHTCIDDPADTCMPERGDADCGGVCMPETRPPTCGDSGAACPPGFECVPDPNLMCDRADGAECRLICRPVSGTECVEDAECPPVPMPCGRCADGSEVCPRTFCDHGRCGLAFASCPSPSACTADADCDAGQVCISPDGQMCDAAVGTTTCGGVCVPKQIARPCGEDGASCPDGFICAVDRSDGCEPDAAGNGCSSICVPAPPPACQTNDECAAIQACHPCRNGQVACAQAQCLNGVCVAEPPRCDDPTQCQNDGDCAVMEACSRCADGSLSCAEAACQDGVCVPRFPACNDPGTCGGIAGFPCPPGYTCVDDPNDECDPNQGWADCTGLCKREDAPRQCGGITGTPCPAGYECADVPDDCDPANGGADCPGACRPAPPAACMADEECAVIAAPCQVCADGTTACPRTSCVNGQCQTTFPCDRADPTAG